MKPLIKILLIRHVFTIDNDMIKYYNENYGQCILKNSGFWLLLMKQIDMKLIGARPMYR